MAFEIWDAGEMGVEAKGGMNATAVFRALQKAYKEGKLHVERLEAGKTHSFAGGSVLVKDDDHATLISAERATDQGLVHVVDLVGNHASNTSNVNLTSRAGRNEAVVTRGFTETSSGNLQVTVLGIVRHVESTPIYDEQLRNFQAA